MKTNWSEMLLIHETSAFGLIGLGTPGLPWYSDRAMVVPARAVVVHDGGPSIKEYRAWLASKEVQLGPQEVIFVRGPTLLKGLEADPGAMEKIHGLVRRYGCRLQVFNRDDDTEEFFAKNGFGVGQIHSAPPEMARSLSNKAELRRMAEAIGQQHAFPEHVITKNPQRVMACVNQFLSRTPDQVPFVVLKRTDLAGGYGTIFVRRTDEVEATVVEFLRRFQKNEVIVEARSQTSHEPIKTVTVEDPDRLRDALQGLLDSDAKIEHFIVRRTVLVSGLGRRRVRRGENLDVACADFIRSFCENEIIIEVGYPHEAYSTQFMLGAPEGGEPFLGVTQQLMEGTHHVGNVLTRFRHPERLSEEAYITMKMMSEAFAKAAQKQQGGYIGTIGFDFIMVTAGPEKGRVFLLECNARQTAATYPLAVSAQMRGRYPEMVDPGTAGKINWGVVMLNGVPTKAKTFAEIKALLGKELLFEGTYGVIPFNIRLMELPEPRCGVIVVGRTLGEAEAMVEETKRRLAA